ncbi:hypothetical protein [Pseudomonas sp. dw_358]|uniref:hypothetical protein n=1 Tax=Pseudomonas sp. dw_358 TaxID=2720083 RepID=UPI001BD31827|nr:hypothetical protein [Pseudomonas sp. dw_358]
MNPQHQIQTLLLDPHLHWVDAPILDKQDRRYLPVPHIDRAAMFHAGHSQIQWPVRVIASMLLNRRSATMNNGAGLPVVKL